MIELALKSTFGIDCKIKKTKISGLALYLTADREFFMAEIEGLSFLIVSVPADDRFGAIALEKQLGKLKASSGYETAFYFEKLTKLQRDALIARRIPFIAGTDQIYLPFLGVVLSKISKAGEEVSAGKMMPATQSLFLYLLYNGKRDYVLKKQAADALKLTRTSITRASDQLKAMGIITEEACGKEVRMRTVTNGYALFRIAKSHLVTPVQRIIYADMTEVTGNLLIAGESALSRVSMLSEPKHEVFAISKTADLVKKLSEVDIRWQGNDTTVKIELWKYDPSLFAEDGMVDPVSMALSLEDCDDERIQGELNRFLEEYEW